MKAFSLLILSAGVLTTLLLMASASEQWQQNSFDDRFEPRIPMTFAHQDHSAQKCIDCHHNYVDQTGQGLCLNCHLRDQDVSFKLEQQFHDLCRGCHEEKQLAGQEHGPIRSCVACHTEDHQP